jgi:Homing endonuclease associated repeat
MTRQEIKELIVGHTAELGHVPSFSEFVKKTQIARRQIRRHFGSYGLALKECNLERSTTGGGGQKIPMDELFLDWVGVVQRMKKLPSMSEYELLSKHECTTLVRRFGSWRQVPYGLKEFAESRGMAEQWKAELELVGKNGRTAGKNVVMGLRPAGAPAIWPEILFNRPVYGLPMWPGPLAYAPVNELGVVFLFGWMAPQLGYVVHRLQPEFPDCEAMRLVGEDKCQLVRIEFEFESRNFLKHMHDVKGCDLIICWRHNWPECPIEVLELKKALSFQQAAISQGNLTTDLHR